MARKRAGQKRTRRKERGPNVAPLRKSKANIDAGLVAPIDLHSEREVVPVKVDTWTRIFIRTLRLTGKPTSAAKAAGRSVGHVYALRSKSPKFRDAWDKALAGHAELRADRMEKEAYRRAVKGTREVHVSGGQIVVDPTTGRRVYKRKFSDALLVRLLEAERPEKFRKTSEQNVQLTVSLTTPALQSRMADPVYRAMVCEGDAASIASHGRVIELPSPTLRDDREGE